MSMVYSMHIIKLFIVLLHTIGVFIEKIPKIN